jgi:nucleotide-binding universal stress UspA family protein
MQSNQENHMYRRILVPVDGSAASMVGLRHAVGLAKDQGARLRVLNVVDDLIIAPMMMEPSGTADLTYILDSLRAEGQKVLKKAAAVAEKSAVKAEAVQVESRGRPVSDVILADARHSRADVIVMGTHGRRGLNRLLLGSDAERVLREAPVPVLLTRHDVARRGTAKRLVPA